jgi:hypothetical protein
MQNLEKKVKSLPLDLHEEVEDYIQGGSTKHKVGHL